MNQRKRGRGSDTAPSSENETDKRNSSSGILGKLLFPLLFLLGLGILLFPTLSDRYHLWKYEQEIAQWEANREKKDYSALWEAAESYNRDLAERQNLRAYLPDEELELIKTLLNPNGNGAMGYIDIEKIDVHLPVYQGTEETQLQSGAGWWIGTSLPTGGESTHPVITAHTGLVKAKMFTDLDQLVEGDTFTLTILDRVMTYRVDQILVTEPMELDPLAIVPGKDYLTLYTCTPYGVNSHRLLVRGERYEAPTEVPLEPTGRRIPVWLIPVVILIVLVIILLAMAIADRRRRRRRRRSRRR